MTLDWKSFSIYQLRRLKGSLHLDRALGDGSGGCLWCEEDREGGESGDAECYGCEEAKDILHSYETGVHLAWVLIMVQDFSMKIDYQ